VLACCASGVVTWKQCLSDNQAWDTLTWFAALIAMAAYLNKFGFISWFSDQARRITARGSRAVVCGLLFGWALQFRMLTDLLVCRLWDWLAVWV
jgi:di/tricarboxylate transporter